MEKISHIIPPSARQTWVSGEIEKPRRVADPVPGDTMGFPRTAAAVSHNEAAMDAVNVTESGGFRGTKLNKVA
jgi:hypothetical protein